jgi:hypothetical protein
LGPEINAIGEGLLLALQWCYAPLIIEVDCLEMVKVLHNEEVDRLVYDSLVEEIKVLMKSRKTSITHVKKF